MLLYNYSQHSLEIRLVKWVKGLNHASSLFQHLLRQRQVGRVDLRSPAPELGSCKRVLPDADGMP